MIKCSRDETLCVSTSQRLNVSFGGDPTAPGSRFLDCRSRGSTFISVSTVALAALGAHSGLPGTNPMLRIYQKTKKKKKHLGRSFFNDFDQSRFYMHYLTINTRCISYSEIRRQMSTQIIRREVRLPSRSVCCVVRAKHYFVFVCALCARFAVNIQRMFANERSVSAASFSNISSAKRLNTILFFFVGPCLRNKFRTVAEMVRK